MFLRSKGSNSYKARRPAPKVIKTSPNYYQSGGNSSLVTSFAGNVKQPHIIPPHPEDDSSDNQSNDYTITNNNKSIEPAASSNINYPVKGTKSSLSKKALSDLPHPYMEYDSALEAFLSKVAKMPINQALEIFLNNHFDSKETFVWQEIPDLQVLYCQTLRATASHTSGLVGYSFFSRSIIRCASGPSHPSYIPTADEKLCPLNSPILIFPLYDWKNNICYIAEIIKPVATSEFTARDQDFIEWFIRKFKILSRWLKPQPIFDSLILDIIPIMPQNDFLNKYQQILSAFYDCRTYEIWKLDKSNMKITQYTDHEIQHSTSMAGVVGEALLREQTLNVVNNRLHNSYIKDVDGDLDEAILAVPIVRSTSSIVYCIALRGPNRSRVFTSDDAESVSRLAPIVLRSFENCEVYTGIDQKFQDSQSERKGLSALLEVVEAISSQLDTKKLTEVIMEKGRLLTDSDRCSLFLVNESRDRLITSLHQGLDNCIDIPIDKGIAGKTVTEARILNIQDVYETDFFDSTTDLESGYRTKSILSVPIYNNRGEIIGVTEMVNKKGDQTFSMWDQRLISLFNVFCGISLENARLFKEMTDMSDQLKSIFNIAFSMSKSESTQRILSDIMQKAKHSIGADRASLFLLDERAGVLSTFISDCDKLPNVIPLTTGVCSTCAKEKEEFFINDAYEHPKFNKMVDTITGYKTRSILVSPILGTEGRVIGVVEMLNKQKKDEKEGKIEDVEFVKKDLQTVKTFGTFASIALENNRLKDIAHFGDCEIEMSKWIGESERKLYDIPKNLRLTDQQIQTVSRLNCFSVDFKGVNHFKELFHFFSLFDILRTFKITNDIFFRFIFTISGLYNDVPYHNWTHACDVTQYVTYEIKTAKLDEVYTKFELFGILISCVCHDTNHEGFNNVYNIKAETPFGILFKDQSVMEMHHITMSIPVITRDDINLFQGLSPDEVKKMWTLFIKLILATDMANHFELVKRSQKLLDDGEWDMTNPEHRLLSMQLVLKVGDISNVSRPFELADKWCDILNNEFFRQGDLEKETGIGLTSPLNDREHVDKPKSQIGFYNFICLPLYNVVAKMFPPLEVNVNSLKSNLETWKSLAAQPPPQPAAPLAAAPAPAADDKK